MFAGKDKRRFGRQQAMLSVRLASDTSEVASPSFSECIGESINLSGGGMCLRVEETMQIDDIVRLRFLPPNTFDLFSGRGRVVRSEQNQDRSYNVALEFVDIPDSEKKLLDYHLHRSE